MSKIPEICTTLKQLLKEQGLTYLALANQLEMSEANVKRMFSQNSMSLKRLEEICEILNYSLADLFRHAEMRERRISELTEEQEKLLVENPRLCLVAVCVRDGWRFEEIVNEYAIDALECTRLLAQLDRLKMIELLPENRYRVLISQEFRWRPGGPLERFITKDVISKFMDARFQEAESFRFYLRGAYSQHSIKQLQKRMDQLTAEAAQLNSIDAKLPLSERTHMGILLAMRPWELSLFQAMRRQK
ncbi:helix-turn-helix domain-containing protein [Teredinibacter franksiae]|uniref:helix-turn-helix domain-containing protein n=1 Tax=Teredinibacter franksiae TaxID=2761453 RepID=UPI0016253DD2|nr:helix-turn-helix transcriptional regulator [Teredinibacter franksiae]